MENKLNQQGGIVHARHDVFVFMLVAFAIFGLTAGAPFLWENGYASAQLLGFGDYLSPFNTRDVLFKLFFSYDSSFNGGTNQSFNQSFLIFYAFHYVIEAIVGTPALASTVIISALLFIAQSGFCKYIHEKLESPLSFTSNLILISGSIIYGLSPYFISNAYPGHISSLILFAFVPYLFILFDRYMSSTTYKMSRNDSFALIVVLMLAAPAFANIGNFIALVIVLSIYSVSIFFYRSSYDISILVKYIYFIFLMFLLNAWWMLPFAVGLSEHIQLNAGSNQISGSVSYATQYATLKNIYTGLPELLFHEQNLIKHQLYTHWFTWGALFLVFFSSVVFLFIEKVPDKIRYWLMALLVVFLSSAFITKGPNAPFGVIFTYLLDNSTVFSIFRRPGSKIYWAYWFSLIAISTFMAIWGADKGRRFRWVQKNGVSFLFVLFAVVSTVLFIRTPMMMGVTPSDGYYQAVNYLNSKDPTRILVFPSTDGQPHSMLVPNDGYYGIDLFRAMVTHSVLIPDLLSAGGGANTSVVKYVNLLADDVSNSSNSCESYKKLGVSYVVFRSDVLMNRAQKDQYKRALAASMVSPELQFVEQYGSVVIFRVRTDCTGGITEQLNYDNKFGGDVFIDRISPTSIEIITEGNLADLEIIQKENYSESWVFTANGGGNFSNVTDRVFQMMYYIFAPVKLLTVNDLTISTKHKLCSGWANCWSIKIGINNELRKFTIRYILQDFFYLGIFVTSISSFFLVVYNFREKNKT